MQKHGVPSPEPPDKQWVGRRRLGWPFGRRVRASETPLTHLKSGVSETTRGGPTETEEKGWERIQRRPRSISPVSERKQDRGKTNLSLSSGSRKQGPLRQKPQLQLSVFATEADAILTPLPKVRVRLEGPRRHAKSVDFGAKFAGLAHSKAQSRGMVLFPVKSGRAPQPALSPDSHRESHDSRSQRFLSAGEAPIRFGDSIRLALPAQDGTHAEDERQVETLVFRRRDEPPESELSAPMALVASGFTAVAVTGFFIVKGLRSLIW